MEWNEKVGVQDFLLGRLWVPRAGEQPQSSLLWVGHLLQIPPASTQNHSPLDGEAGTESLRTLPPTEERKSCRRSRRSTLPVFRWLWSEKRASGAIWSIHHNSYTPAGGCLSTIIYRRQWEGNPGLSPQSHAHGVLAHSVTSLSRKTNKCLLFIGCISLRTAVPGCLNSINGAVITRYLLVTLLGLFHSLGWQTAWIGLVLLTASLPFLHHCHLFLLSPIFPKPSTPLIMMMAGVTGLTDSPTPQLSSLGTCWNASFCFVLEKVRGYGQK